MHELHQGCSSLKLGRLGNNKFEQVFGEIINLNNTRKIQLPLCVQLKNAIKVDRHNLKVLPNGLMICKIKLSNSNQSITCDALIDTGADCSILCKSIFDKISDGVETQKTVASTLDGEEDVMIASLITNIPENNWSSMLNSMVIKDLSKREEYQAIIGMNILSNYQLVYNGLKRVAYLQEC